MPVGKRKISITILRKDGTLHSRDAISHPDVDSVYVNGRDVWVAPLDAAAESTAFNITVL